MANNIRTHHVAEILDLYNKSPARGMTRLYQKVQADELTQAEFETVLMGIDRLWREAAHEALNTAERLHLRIHEMKNRAQERKISQDLA